MIGRLYHYSAEPFVFDPTRIYRQDPREALPIKPNGLWCSVESDDEDSFGWREWCEREGFGLSRLTHRTELTLQPGANVLHLASSSALLAFTRRYESAVAVMIGSPIRQIDWTLVAHDYQGLVIAPYDWDLRLDWRTQWYYGWDCASGCIWDGTAVAVTSTASTPAGTAPPPPD